MKILLSAYACSPDAGTRDDEIGWQWATALARAGRDVTILTQTLHQEQIEAWLRRNREVTIGVRYVSAPGRGWLGNLLWQVAALVALLRSGEWRDFDIIHHLTPGSIRRWSLLWALPRPFVFGPATGGERAPLRFVAPMGTVPVLQELLWRVVLWLSLIDPVFLAMQARAGCILLVSPQTAQGLFPRARHKATAAIALGAPEGRAVEPRSALPVRILFNAPLRYTTGVDLLADVAAEIESRGKRHQFVLLGDGPRQAAIEKKLKRIRHLKILAAGAPQPDQLAMIYRESDLAVFPSLSNDSGAAVLDAMANGLPVVCLDLGTPAMLVGSTGEVVATEGKDYQDVCRDLADAIVRLAEDPRRRLALGAAARERAATLSWDHAARVGYAAILARIAPP